MLNFIKEGSYGDSNMPDLETSNSPFFGIREIKVDFEPALHEIGDIYSAQVYWEESGNLPDGKILCYISFDQEHSFFELENEEEIDLKEEGITFEYLDELEAFIRQRLSSYVFELFPDRRISLDRFELILKGKYYEPEPPPPPEFERFDPNFNYELRNMRHEGIVESFKYNMQHKATEETLNYIHNFWNIFINKKEAIQSELNKNRMLKSKINAIVEGVNYAKKL